MTGASGLAESLLATLDPEQRAAALLPDGPAQVIAPAGSGKTTTLIARLGVLLARGVDPQRIGVVTFNRDAAIELSERIARRLAPTAPEATRIEVRTLHAMARRVHLEARGSIDLLRDRAPLLRAIRRRAMAEWSDDDERPEPPEAGALDTAISAWKVEGRTPEAEAAPLVAAYLRQLAARGQLDFDDLLAGALRLLESDAALRERWRSRFSHLLVDEFQDVDAAQLRFCQELAEPERNLFVVGDDDQTIYAWRLADVRRILGFGDRYPGAQRIQLATNYRCPAPVIAAAARLIAVNRERFVKRIEPPPETDQDVPGSLLALSLQGPQWDRELAALAARATAEGETCCVLARTRSELIPVRLALVRANVVHRSSISDPLDSPQVMELLRVAGRMPAGSVPFRVLVDLRAARGWRRTDTNDDLGDEEHAALDALLGWSTNYAALDAFLAAAAAAAERITALRSPNALVELVTVHGAKGREWRTVVVLGMEEDRMPNRRSLQDAADPVRALEEERRLAYVAVTRATRRLVLAFDPTRPSRFIAEMGLLARDPPRARRA